MSETPERLSRKLAGQLKHVNCPLLGSREESWQWELLFSSSENHNQFLKWILCSFDENLAESLENLLFQSLTIEEQERKLFEVCCSVGFCGQNDLKIINGTADKGTIQDFWELILDLHLTHIKSLESTEDKDLPIKYLSGVSILECTSLSNDFVIPKTKDQMSSGSPSTWKILPPDLDHEAREYAKIHSIKSPTKEEVSEMLTKTERRSQHEPLLDNPQDLHDQVVSSILSLQEMVPEFTKCHQQLEPWLKENLKEAKASNLETLVTEASSKMAQLQQMLDDLAFEMKNKDLSQTVVVENKKVSTVGMDDNSHLIDILNDTMKAERK